MKLECYVNESNSEWYLTFGSPDLPNYEGVIVPLTEEVACAILKKQE